MWECTQCGTKNNNSSKKCHRNGCNAVRPKGTKVKVKRVFDFCPKCLHETYWKASKFHQSYMKANGTMSKKWVKTWTCEECGRHAKMVGAPIKNVDEVALESQNAEIR